MTQTEIAEELGIGQSTVSKDIRAIHHEWRETAVRDFDLARERELRKLDRVEREAWAAWERSQKPAQSATVSSNGQAHGTSQRSSKTVTEQNGDSRYLEQVQKCIASRRSILGLDLPSKVALTSPDGETAYHTHIISELMRLAESQNSLPEIVDATVIRKAIDSRAVDENDSSCSEENIDA